MAKAHKTSHRTEHKDEAKIVEHHGFKLNPKKMGFAFGVLKSLGLGFLALLASTLGWGSALVRTLSSVFLGYEASFVGMIFGLIWGFACGFLGGYIFALIYNKSEKCCCC